MLRISEILLENFVRKKNLFLNNNKHEKQNIFDFLFSIYRCFCELFWVLKKKIKIKKDIFFADCGKGICESTKPVKAYFNRFLRIIIRGKHSLNLWGPGLGRGAYFFERKKTNLGKAETLEKIESSSTYPNTRKFVKQPSFWCCDTLKMFISWIPVHDCSRTRKVCCQFCVVEPVSILII